MENFPLQDKDWKFLQIFLNLVDFVKELELKTCIQDNWALRQKQEGKKISYLYAQSYLAFCQQLS